jgi:ribosomal 50S subunit-recycling heat shock protein
VPDELAGVAAGPGEAGTVDDVVQAALEQLEEVVTGLAAAAAGFLVVADELLLEDAVGVASLLLLAKLQQVLALLDAAAAVLAGGVGTLLEGGVPADEVDTEASRRQGKTGDNLLQLLECRLDNVVYRAGFARTRRHARQLVTHGHFTVNGRKVDIPSYQVAAHDVIDVREKSLEMTPFIVARETHGERVVPAWLEAIPARMRILVHQLPVRAQIDLPVQEQLIVEYYSKK